jgi:hypothetical protein
MLIEENPMFSGISAQGRRDTDLRRSMTLASEQRADSFSDFVLCARCVPESNGLFREFCLAMTDWNTRNSLPRPALVLLPHRWLARAGASRLKRRVQLSVRHIRPHSLFESSRWRAHRKAAQVSAFPEMRCGAAFDASALIESRSMFHAKSARLEKDPPLG